MKLKEKIKNFLRVTIIKVEPFYSRGPCPLCGALLNVPLTRDVTAMRCNFCEKELFTTAVGLIQADRERLKSIFAEVGMWVNILDREFEERERLH